MRMSLLIILDKFAVYLFNKYERDLVSINIVSSEKLI